MIRIILLTFILSISWATDSLEYAKLYGKLSSHIYEIETIVQDETGKSVYLELEQFSIESAKKSQYRVLIEGSHSFKFQAQFLLTDLTLENIEEQIEALADMILVEVNKQIEVREKDQEILERSSTPGGLHSFGVQADLQKTVLWYQLPAIEKGRHHWLRTTLSAGVAEYFDTAHVGVETTIWTHVIEYSSDLTSIKDKKSVFKVGSVGAIIKPSVKKFSTELTLELVSFSYSEILRINETLKFFYEGALSLAVGFHLEQNADHSYLPFGGKLEIGLIISDKISVKIGGELELPILTDWKFEHDDNAFKAHLTLELFSSENSLFYVTTGYSWNGEHYHGSARMGLILAIGFRIKL